MTEANDSSAGDSTPAPDETNAEPQAGDQLDVQVDVDDLEPGEADDVDQVDEGPTQDGYGRPLPGHSAWDALTDAEREASDEAAKTVLSQRMAPRHLR